MTHMKEGGHVRGKVARVAAPLRVVTTQFGR
jgi:hypothetical protein